LATYKRELEKFIYFDQNLNSPTKKW